MTQRIIYAKQNEDEERGDCRAQCGTAEDTRSTKK